MTAARIILTKGDQVTDIVAIDGSGPQWTYTDVDGDGTALYTAQIPEVGPGIYLKTSKKGCSIPVGDVTDFIAAIRATVKAAEKTDRYVPAEYAPEEIDVTEVRKDLIAESYEHHAAVKALAAKGRDTGGLTDHEAELIETHVSAGDYAYLLAGLLRIIEERHGADEAREMAALFDAVREAGGEVLEDANADLDERAAPVPDPNAEVHVTLGPAIPGVGKSLAAALMENDAPAEPETTPAVSS